MFVARPLSLCCALGAAIWMERADVLGLGCSSRHCHRVYGLFVCPGFGTSNPDDVGFVETFTWSVILATILLQATTAVPWPDCSGSRRKHPKGWIIVGAHSWRHCTLRNQPSQSSGVADRSKQTGHSRSESRRLHAIEQDARALSWRSVPTLLASATLLHSPTRGSERPPLRHLVGHAWQTQCPGMGRRRIRQRQSFAQGLPRRSDLRRDGTRRCQVCGRSERPRCWGVSSGLRQRRRHGCGTGPKMLLKWDCT